MLVGMMHIMDVFAHWSYLAWQEARWVLVLVFSFFFFFFFPSSSLLYMSAKVDDVDMCIDELSGCYGGVSSPSG